MTKLRKIVDLMEINKGQYEIYLREIMKKYGELPNEARVIKDKYNKLFSSPEEETPMGHGKNENQPISPQSHETMSPDMRNNDHKAHQ